MEANQRHHYSYEELTDMIAVYYHCNKNQRQAAALYARRFPDRRHPNHGFFHTLYERLTRNGQFYQSRRPINVRQRQQEIINNVREAVLANPHSSTRAIAADLNMKHVTVHRIIKHSLKMHPFKRHTTHKLVPGDAQRRLNFCEWLIEHVDFNDAGNDQFLKRILWSDEATFASNGCINRHNEHHYAEHNPHCIKETNVQGRWIVNVWIGILGDHVIGPEFLEQNVNANNYANFLLHRLDELLEDIPLAERLQIIFQQDGHPAHTSRLARNILYEKFPERWIGVHGPQEWPPRSPDLTPLDFFVWGFLRQKIYDTLPQNPEELKNKIRRACAEITPLILQKVRQNLMRRIAFCLEQDGNYIEHIL